MANIEYRVYDEATTTVTGLYYVTDTFEQLIVGLASEKEAGLMSADDKQILDNLNSYAIRANKGLLAKDTYGNIITDLSNFESYPESSGSSADGVKSTVSKVKVSANGEMSTDNTSTLTIPVVSEGNGCGVISYDQLSTLQTGINSNADNISAIQNDYVTTDTEQTISGEKTFTSTIKGDLKGDVTGKVKGNVTGNLTGNVTGDLTGNADTATKLKTGVTITTNLESTSSATFDGSKNITPGVNGILPVTNGGTGESSLSSVTVGNATNATTATKLGSATIGSSTKPIYLNNGTATESTSTVGSGVKPVYLNNGTITATASTVGGTKQPVYMSNGTITALSGSAGSTSKPVYLNNGVISECSATVGSTNHPVYMDNGTITACSGTVGSITTPIYIYNGAFATGTSIPTVTKGNTYTTLYYSNSTSFPSSYSATTNYYTYIRLGSCYLHFMKLANNYKSDCWLYVADSTAFACGASLAPENSSISNSSNMGNFLSFINTKVPTSGFSKATGYSTGYPVWAIDTLSMFTGTLLWWVSSSP